MVEQFMPIDEKNFVKSKNPNLTNEDYVKEMKNKGFHFSNKIIDAEKLQQEEKVKEEINCLLRQSFHQHMEAKKLLLQERNNLVKAFNSIFMYNLIEYYTTDKITEIIGEIKP